jgi:hypothetical protein
VRYLTPGNGKWNLAVEIAVAQALGVLEVIAGTGTGASVVATRYDIGPGTHRLDFDIPIPDIRYCRIRGKAYTGRDNNNRAASLAGFATSGIFPE